MSQASNLLLKICATCGRQITWRKKWEKNWSSIIYCSDSCRRHKVKPNSLDTHFESAILLLLQRRRSDELAGKSGASDRLLTCEDVEEYVLAARNNALARATLASEQSLDAAVMLPDAEASSPKGLGGVGQESSAVEEDNNMETKDPKRTRERCRQAARRLAARGEVVIMQAGKVVDPSFGKGILELGLP